MRNFDEIRGGKITEDQAKYFEQLGISAEDAASGMMPLILLIVVCILIHFLHSLAIGHVLIFIGRVTVIATHAVGVLALDFTVATIDAIAGKNSHKKPPHGIPKRSE